MPIAISDTHRELGTVARSFLENNKARAAARALLDAPDETMPTFWAELAELGWLGLHVPEAYGGSGFGLSELAVVLEELGRAVAPGPFLPTVMASMTIDRAGDDAQRERLLPGLADGSRVGALGLAGDLRLGPDGTLEGDSGPVLGAGLADVFLLRAGDDMVVVERGEGIDVSVTTGLDPTRRIGHVVATGTRAEPSAVLRGGADVARQVAWALAAAEASGGAQECVERGERVREGPDAVRPSHRDVPGGQAPLRQHARRRGARHRCGVGRGPRRDRCARALRARVGRGGCARAARVLPQRAAQHPGPRWHRVHVGARRPRAAPARRDARGAVRRRRRGRHGHRVLAGGSHPGPRVRAAARSRAVPRRDARRGRRARGARGRRAAHAR